MRPAFHQLLNPGDPIVVGLDERPLWRCRRDSIVSG